MPAELKPGVYWVGAVDWGVRFFHGHELSTQRGTSYNAYLIVDEKIALLDTVRASFAPELLERIREIVDPAKIDIVVAAHAEPDHSGSLPEILRYAPNAQLVVSKQGAKSIEGYFHRGWNHLPVGTGDRIALGANELVFTDAAFLHWPDSMFTYLTGHNILFPNDTFGQHYATAFRFDDEVCPEELAAEALKYYVNIINPYSHLVTPKIEEILGFGWPIDMIAPSHGIIWRQQPGRIIEQYREWAEQKAANRALVLYASMWEATRKMADAIGEGLSSTQTEYKVIDASTADRNDLNTEIFNARAILIGSSTINKGPLPDLAPILIDLKGLKFKNKVGAAFGSYGWSADAVKHIEEHLAACGIEVVRPGLKCRWQPAAEDLAACRTFGREIGEALKA